MPAGFLGLFLDAIINRVTKTVALIASSMIYDQYIATTGSVIALVRPISGHGLEIALLKCKPAIICL